MSDLREHNYVHLSDIYVKVIYVVWLKTARCSNVVAVIFLKS